jgi:hypothetical protein
VFETVDAIRRRDEADIWRHEQQRGKTQFLLRGALSIGCALVLLTTPLLHLHFAAATKAAIIAYNNPPCLLLGYLGALLAWRRGRRLTASAPGEPSV